ncbi:hypothetical protein [Xinfangfangia pollutisoli]|uniref:hypothetical protein n=1 Tax=Xinfangfangia pollutisoli TaxID=2865960 RepID=UPI001CD7C6C5|nr:hypothetical protein [Xinfangfangia pollutisoli]
MSAVTIIQMADRVASLLEDRLGARGKTLRDKLRRAGRRLPRRVRMAGLALAEAAEMAQNPKLLVRVDEAQVAADYDIVLRHLGGVNPAARRRGALLDFAASVAFGLLMLGVALVFLLVWRGLV